MTHGDRPPRNPGPFDVLVLGSGVAGLSAAVRMASAGRYRSGLRVGVLTKGELTQSATRWAQGGVAAVLGGDEDSTDLHLADTLAAGAGLCDPEAVRVLVDEGPHRVHELIAMGAQFDREVSGSLALAREGGHSRARVVHAGGAATGVEVERALVAATRAAATTLERWFALDLVVEGGRCRGVLALPPGTRSDVGAPLEVTASGAGRVAGDLRPVVIRAEHVVLATGGIGQLFAVTTNPAESTGDGVAMALRAGVGVADVEFVQFHPTALHHPAMPRPLLSEALRGHGALLRDGNGDRFVDELAPRDVVSRAMAQRMADDGVEHLWLDATGLDRFDERFPTIAASLTEIGLDPSVDWLPIAPAAHHLSGGVLTDLWGATELPGLWAAGEVACTGVHGANRLASNSLLEGMVFGARLAEMIASGRRHPTPTGALDPAARIGLRRVDLVEAAEPEAGSSPGGLGDLLELDMAKVRDQLQRSMTAGAGVVRSAESLESARAALTQVERFMAGRSRSTDLAAVAHSATTATTTTATITATTPSDETRSGGELTNLATVARALLESASLREESRGAHSRSDFPHTAPDWRCRLVHRREDGRRPPVRHHTGDLG